MSTLLNAVLAFMFVFTLLFIVEIIILRYIDKNQLGDIHE